MILFPKRKQNTEIKKTGIPLRCLVTDIQFKKGLYTVIVLYTEPWINYQKLYTSDSRKEKPRVYKGGEANVYLDTLSGKADYFVDAF